MMEELRPAVKMVGLELHFGKTKILANAVGRRQTLGSHVEVGDEVDILRPDQSTKYLAWKSVRIRGLSR